MVDNSKLIYDGNIIDAREPVIPANSRGLMYGDGCFETMRKYGGGFLHLQEHIHRFEAAADYLGIAFPPFFKGSILNSSLKQLLKENDLESTPAIFRFQLWRDGGRGYETDHMDEAHFTVTVSPLPDIKKSIKLAFVETKRIPNAALPSDFKLSNNINYITAAKEAAHKGADDALMQTVNGHISETTIANIFWVKDGVVFTPSSDCDLLPGITREIMIKLCGNLFDEPVKQGKFMPEEILSADGVWICNSVREILPVAAIDEANFQIDHAFIAKLKKEFENYKEEHLSE